MTPPLLGGLGPVNRELRQTVHKWGGLPDRRGLKKSLRLVGRWARDDMNIAAINREGVCCRSLVRRWSEKARVQMWPLVVRTGTRHPDAEEQHRENMGHSS